MRILVNSKNITQSTHARKRLLLDTMILCYAHDRSNPNYAKASLIVKASITGLVKAYISYQNLSEFYSIMTGKKVKKPLTPKEATEICALYEESVTIGKLLPTNVTYNETFESATSLSLTNGDIFDCVLAHTAKGKVDTIWTENTHHFKEYNFLSAENPLEWTWEEVTS